MDTKDLVELAVTIFRLQLLKMEAAGSSIVLITMYKTTRHHIRDGNHLDI
jgi:hypothetical protein